ncbi:MAG: hypothetical protein WDW38_002350 [Sanguina aurantia]
MTLEQLAEHDGSKPGVPLLLSIQGTIYNITSGKQFYGPDGVYPFAGKEVARAFALLSTEVSSSTCSAASVRAPSHRSAVITAAAAASAAVPADYRMREPKDVRVLVVGPTGYIGKFVVKELIKRGFNVVAFSREAAGIKGKLGKADIQKEFPGADVRFGDVQDPASIKAVAFKEQVDVVISCLASRTGGKKDSWAIDYQATKNVLDAARAGGAKHFVLLSAICVQKPLLEFQKAKLKLESDLLAASDDITHSIVRPTAFFKSVGGQIQIVKDGGPFVMFGDGKLAACKPISERDLASFIGDCVVQSDKINKVLPIGGPGRAYTAIEQADMLFKITGKKTFYFKVPVALMDGIIDLLDFLTKYFPNLEDAAEFGRIGKYYAVESMLVYDPARKAYMESLTPSYGNDTLENFFKDGVTKGMAGQELGDQGFGL